MRIFSSFLIAISLLVALPNGLRAAKFAWGKPMKVRQVADKDKICFAMYTVDRKVLKLFVQFYPLADKDSREVKLEVRQEGAEWRTVAQGAVRENPYHGKYHRKAWNLLFRVEKWDSSRDWQYRVVALDGKAVYTGKIRKDPVDKNEIVVAAFTGRSEYDRDPKTNEVKSLADIVESVRKQNPDLLFFSGDQVYHHKDHYACWIEFGELLRDLMRDRPTVCLPDDHDVGQGNLWGSDGRHTKDQNDGGYVRPAAYVKEVEFAQTSCLPDPYDPTPVEQGIGVHYCRLTLGGIDFAIIEDRKFKSGPLEIFPELKTQKRPDLPKGVTPAYLDSPKAILYGERQLKFLREWGADWRGAVMKCVLSPTILCQGHSGPMDLDTNGWPQNKRNKALREIRKAFAFMLAGDQHLATFIHQGIDEFGDAGYSFCVPSIVNHFPRIWKPNWKPERSIKGDCPFLGDYYDRFGNRITMLAHSTPGKFKVPYNTDNKRYLNSTGWGIVRFNKAARTITSECWPRGADVSNPSGQYPGWPITVSQLDNYSRKPFGFLPEINVTGMTDPVVQVINEKDNTIVYTIRIKGNHWKPMVFEKGSYTLTVGDQNGHEQRFTGLAPGKDAKSLKISF